MNLLNFLQVQFYLGSPTFFNKNYLKNLIRPLYINLYNFYFGNLILVKDPPPQPSASAEKTITLAEERGCPIRQLIPLKD